MVDAEEESVFIFLINLQLNLFLHVLCLYHIFKTNNDCILVGVIYRPPDTDKILYIDKLNEIINSFQFNRYKYIIISGDFNYDLLNYANDLHTQTFLDTLASYSLIPLITKPTRITDTSATLLDNIFVSSPSEFTAGSLISTFSDHFPVFFIA